MTLTETKVPIFSYPYLNSGHKGKHYYPLAGYEFFA